MREEEKEGKEGVNEDEGEDGEGGGYTQRRGDRGRGGQTRPYTQNVSLTINSYYYYIITIREQRQCIVI